MSLLDLNLASDIIQKLNAEMQYFLSDKMNIPPDKAPLLLHLYTCGDEHKITFSGIVIWDSFIERLYEQPTVEEEIEMNERENLEKFLRKSINREIAFISQINL